MVVLVSIYSRDGGYSPSVPADTPSLQPRQSPLRHCQSCKAMGDKVPPPAVDNCHPGHAETGVAEWRAQLEARPCDVSAKAGQLLSGRRVLRLNIVSRGGIHRFNIVSRRQIHGRPAGVLFYF